ILQWNFDDNTKFLLNNNSSIPKISITMLMLLYKDFYILLDNLDLSEEMMNKEKTWSTYIPLLYCINQIIEHHPNIKGLHLFDIVSQRNYGTCYMPIETNHLYGILKRAGNNLVVGILKTQLGDSARSNWAQIFNIQKYGERFQCCIETDLVVIGLDLGRKNLCVTVDYNERVIQI
ncbi:2879_t:CDS:2, partial [Funneliformis geosporum]